MRVFKYYCASGATDSISTMALSEFWTFLRHSRLAEGVRVVPRRRGTLRVALGHSPRHGRIPLRAGVW